VGRGAELRRGAGADGDDLQAILAAVPVQVERRIGGEAVEEERRIVVRRDAAVDEDEGPLWVSGLALDHFGREIDRRGGGLARTSCYSFMFRLLARRSGSLEAASGFELIGQGESVVTFLVTTSSSVFSRPAAPAGFGTPSSRSVVSSPNVAFSFCSRFPF